MTKSKFQERLLILMQETGLTSPRKFSEATGIPYTTIYNYMRADVDPRAYTLIMVSEYFGVSVDWLLGLKEERN